MNDATGNRFYREAPPNAAQVSDLQRLTKQVGKAVIEELKLRQWAVEAAAKFPAFDPVNTAKAIYEFIKPDSTDAAG
jgi:hypothetical protein